MKKLLLAAICFPIVGLADSEQFTQCMAASAGVTSAMLSCIATETKSQDQRLNLEYKKAMSALSPSRQKTLRAAQKKWLAYRDANCQFYKNPEGGSSAIVDANDCLRSATEQRADELSRIANPTF